MRTLQMFVMRWKACARQPYAWAFVIVAMLAALLPALSERYETDTTLPVGLVNEDGGDLSLKLVEAMGRYEELTVYTLNRETAMRWLAMGRLECVFVIERYYSRRISKGDFEDVVTMYTAPASSAATTLSETMINSTLMIWIEETALIRMSDFLESQGLPFGQEQQDDLRTRFEEMLAAGSAITVEKHIEDPPQAEGGEYEALLKGTAWYAAFVTLFMIVSAGWVIETRRRVIGERLRAAGIHPLSALLGSALAVVAVCMLGWLILDGLLCALLGHRPWIALPLALPALLYLAGVMGVTLVIASLLSRTVQLMLIAPVFTLAHGVLCGMLAALPGWAATLVYISYIFPGRWFMLEAAALMNGGDLHYALGQAACALFWLAAGAALVLAGSRRIATES